MNLIQCVGLGAAAAGFFPDRPLSAVGLMLFGFATAYADKWDAWAKSR